jgi:outer membrane protein TolC
MNMCNAEFVDDPYTDSRSPSFYVLSRRLPIFVGTTTLLALLTIFPLAQLCLAQAPAPTSSGPTYSSAPSSMTESTGTGSSRNPFLGSVPSGKATAEVIPISFADAIQRGLRQNLGVLLASDSTLSARGQRWKELSALLPNVNGTISETVQQTSLGALGLRIPGLPRVVGPFNYFDARAGANQSVFNLNYIERERAARQNVKAAQFNYKDARELVVLAVGNAYLQALAGAARVETADAQVKTAQALYNKAVDQQKAGVSPAIDTLRAQVELQARQQQLIVARNDFAKQKLALARIIGLPPGQEFSLSSKAPYEPLTTNGVEQSLQRAYATRSDYQASQARVRAAELSRRAAGAQYFPSFGLEADYGDIGVNPSNSNGTYHVAGTISIPIFQGGKTHADVLQAEATLRQNREQLDDLRGQIDYEVRTALLDLNAAADQVEVARSSVDLATQTLTQAQDRFAAGVTDNLEVVQAQEALSSANENYIASLYAHNLAKVAFAKAIGYAEEGVKNYLKGK